MLHRFAHLPWGWLFLALFLLRVPLTYIAYSIAEVPLWLYFLEGWVEILEAATFICWLEALFLRWRERKEEEQNAH